MVTDANGNLADFDFDELGRLVKITQAYIDESELRTVPLDTITVTDLLPTSTQRLLLDYGTPDATLNVTSQSESRNGAAAQATSYGYDGSDRLTLANYPTAAFGLPATDDSFSYDDAGNRDNAGSPGSFSYNVNNQIEASPGRGYAFDEDGNLTAITDGATPTPNPVADLTWDYGNRLQTYQVAASDLIATYRYDPFGRRVKKTVDPDGAGSATPTTTWYLWDGDRLLAEYDGAGDRQVRYAYAGGFAPIQVARKDGSGEDIYDVHSDPLDTPRLLTDSSGAAAWRASYEAYGKAALDGANTFPFNVRFPGQYYDAETETAGTGSGLHYNRFRYYDPAIGRYIEADPIGQVGATNVFEYALNNPTRFFDPFGLIEGSEANKRKRKAIANLAAAQNGKTDWSKDKDLGSQYPAGSWKCSKFDCDITRAAGADMSVTVPDDKGGEETRCPTAAENARGNVPNSRLLSPSESPEPGDIVSAAFPGPVAPGDPTGHTAIVIDDGSGGTTTIGAHENKVGPPGIDRFGGSVRYRRYTGD